MGGNHVGTVVIGGSQAGLAVECYLRRPGLPFVIVDENKKVRDAWRNRWETLRLFTPARYEGLPGMPFPGRPYDTYPSKDRCRLSRDVRKECFRDMTVNQMLLGAPRAVEASYQSF